MYAEEGKDEEREKEDEAVLTDPGGGGRGEE